MGWRLLPQNIYLLASLTEVYVIRRFGSNNCRKCFHIQIENCLMIKGKSFPVCFLGIYLFRKADFISLIERAYLEVNLCNGHVT